MKEEEEEDGNTKSLILFWLCISIDHPSGSALWEAGYIDLEFSECFKLEIRFGSHQHIDVSVSIHSLNEYLSAYYVMSTVLGPRHTD